MVFLPHHLRRRTTLVCAIITWVLLMLEMSLMMWPHLKLLSFPSSCKASLIFYLVYRRGRDGDVHAHTSSGLSPSIQPCLFFFLPPLLLSQFLFYPRAGVWISKTRLPVFWQPRLCEFWYWTDFILFDVFPQGFKGKPGHAGFPGQKVSQALIALPSYSAWLFVYLQLPSVACAVGQVVLSSW